MSDIRCYSAKIATLYGPDCATFINHLQYRIGENRSEGRYFYDGRYWTYNSTSSLIERLYPYWSQDHMDRIIKKLVDAGVILVGNYNKVKYDKTRWFAFVDENKFLGPKTGKEIKPREDTSSNENSESHPEPKNQNLSPQTVAAVHSAKTRNVEPQGFQPVTCLKTVGTNQVTKQDVDEYQSVKTQLVTPKGFQGNSSPQTVAAVHSAKSRNRYRENAEPIPLISFNKKVREDVFEKNDLLSEGSKNVLKEKKARGSRLSPDWELPETDREWALKHGLFNEQIDIQVEKFRDHWISTTQNPLKVDWSAAWRVWLRRAKDIRLIEPASNVKIDVQTIAPVEQSPQKTPLDPNIQKWIDSKDIVQGIFDQRKDVGFYNTWISRHLEFRGFSAGKAVFMAASWSIGECIKEKCLDVLYEAVKKIFPDFSPIPNCPESSSIRIELR